MSRFRRSGDVGSAGVPLYWLLWGVPRALVWAAAG
jgi:hypothetical protein